MRREVGLAVAAGETWAALKEDGVVVELRVARGGMPSRVGEIWLGRVVALRPELPAALVDIGIERPAFLSAEDVAPRSRFKALREGEAVVVEIAKDARADKAAGVTMRLLRAVAAPPVNAKPPLRLDEPLSPTAALVAPWLEPAPDSIMVDSRAAYAELRHWLQARHPVLVTRLAAINEPLYERFGIGDAVEQALESRLALPGGGFLLIEPTALGVAIDVDSGAAKSAIAANLEAARALALQIRLRNLAGPMTVGFVGMNAKGERERVLAALKKALARHAPDCQALGWTRLGHVELVRKRRAPALAESLAATPR
ncbi:MAG: ribonuclease E/G [Alphaproteobacteria bacterium]|nr:ribonuclease E/G [Alphaproteobacteria bacterium]